MYHSQQTFQVEKQYIKIIYVFFIFWISFLDEGYRGIHMYILYNTIVTNKIILHTSA